MGGGLPWAIPWPDFGIKHDFSLGVAPVWSRVALLGRAGKVRSRLMWKFRPAGAPVLHLLVHLVYTFEPWRESSPYLLGAYATLKMSPARHCERFSAAIYPISTRRQTVVGGSRILLAVPGWNRDRKIEKIASLNRSQ